MISSVFMQALREFSDLVLGPERNLADASIGSDASNLSAVFISEVIKFFKDLDQIRGQIVEISSVEPAEIESLIDHLAANNEQRTLCFLGVEQNRVRNLGNGASVIVMPSQKASQILFAAHELIKSEAIELIVVQEILLKDDNFEEVSMRNKWIIGELKKLKMVVTGHQAVLVLLNPKTPERSLIENELQFICSHQFELKALRGS